MSVFKGNSTGEDFTGVAEFEETEGEYGPQILMTVQHLDDEDRRTMGYFPIPTDSDGEVKEVRVRSKLGAFLANIKEVFDEDIVEGQEFVDEFQRIFGDTVITGVRHDTYTWKGLECNNFMQVKPLEKKGKSKTKAKASSKKEESAEADFEDEAGFLRYVTGNIDGLSKADAKAFLRENTRATGSEFAPKKIQAYLNEMVKTDWVTYDEDDEVYSEAE